jgi:hypothetical protein
MARQISERRSAAKAKWEANQCALHISYRLKGKAGTETYPNDKREIAGRQVLQTKVRACTLWSVPKTVRPS